MFTVEVLLGTLNVSDVLRSSPIKDNQSDYLSGRAEQYINYVAEHSVPMAMTLDEIKAESSRDDCHHTLRYVQNCQYT